MEFLLSFRCGFFFQNIGNNLWWFLIRLLFFFLFFTPSDRNLFLGFGSFQMSLIIFGFLFFNLFRWRGFVLANFFYIELPLFDLVRWRRALFFFLLVTSFFLFFVTFLLLFFLRVTNFLFVVILVVVVVLRSLQFISLKNIVSKKLFCTYLVVVFIQRLLITVSMVALKFIICSPIVYLFFWLLIIILIIFQYSCLYFWLTNFGITFLNIQITLTLLLLQR